MTAYTTVGHAVRRVDGADKVTGAARYLADIDEPGMLHAAVLRSPFPRAVVTELDVSAALAHPNVYAVVTPDDVVDLPPVRIFGDSPPIQRIVSNRPSFVGDAVAAVAAATPEAARAALELIEVTYDELPACLTVDDALAATELLHPDAPGNRAGPPVEISRGDPDTVLESCAHVFRDVYTTQRQSAQTIEPLACICDWTDPSLLHVTTHLDSLLHFRNALAESLNFDPESVVVTTPPALGATFGLKNSLIASFEPLCALLSRRAGRPVKLALSAEESMSATVTRHAARIELTTGVDDDGRILARTADVLLDSGAYGWGYVVALSMVGKWATLYRTENLRFSATSVYTNHIPGGACRAVGTTQIHFAMESQLDEIARTMGIDALELRRRNVVGVGDRLPFGTEIRSFGVEECLTRGAEHFGWTGPTEHGPETTDNPLGVSRGVGMALGMHHAGLTGLLPEPERSECGARLEPDGRVVVTVGVIEKGQGSAMTLTIIAAEELGLPTESIHVHNPGTALAPPDYSGAEASRTTYVVGRAVADAARQLREQIRAKAANLLECAVGDVEISPGGANGPSDEVIGFADLAPIEVTGSFAPSDSDPLPVVGAHFCEVEVDHTTGIVRLLRHVAAQDVGRVINILGCIGQAEGGIHHGIGFALLEDFVYEDGQPLNPNFMGYKVLMAPDMPDIDVVLVEDPDPDGGPFGSKGIGTPIMPAVAPAIANAVRDAIGSRLRDLPLSPDKVLPALVAREVTSRPG